MADSDSNTRTDSRDASAELRITRVTALDHNGLISVMTYLLARHPDTFPQMLDDALSSVSPKAGS
jgi:hypothetical protein